MTREEINKRIMQACKNMWNEKVCKEIEKVLEPCEDCVSRQAVDHLCFRFLRANSDDNIAFYEHFRDLPSVTPKGVTVTDFADKCRECGKQKKGKWIFHKKSVSTGFKDLRECSCCHCYFRWEMPRNSYCPNCGVEMEGEE